MRPNIFRICTYCGERKKDMASDHVIPKCLFVRPSNDRSIIVPSCSECTDHSEERALANFMMFLDDDIYKQRFPMLQDNPQALPELDMIAAMTYETPEDKVLVFPSDQVTRQFQKVFMGLRRWLLEPKGRWNYKPIQYFRLVKLERTEPGAATSYVIRFLPMKVGVPSVAHPLADDGSKVETFNQTFRDFQYGIKSEMPDGRLMMGLRYMREEVGRLLLYCFMIPPRPGIIPGRASPFIRSRK